ncbi:DUF4911 domain-containing protein [Thermincola potens]|uniref:DUF4911 domain-containing protein n=1 Tax=Thermincola potens (strain JR) TaxID=635013 RepID=D5X7P2_THEPJ|nr:DUF4911 domain-containing protein [Thermincola potens]ADG82612.1 hypothetical protein TherJR_1763 [Thermincola potens JR]
MGRRYKGKFCNRIQPDMLGTGEVYYEVRVDTDKINFFTKILEAHERLAFVVQVDPARGTLGMLSTKSQEHELMQVLQSLPLKIEIL